MTVAEYIAELGEPRRTDVQQLRALIGKGLPKLKASIQSGMIGYGTYRYTYESGRAGEAPIVALSSRKNYISVYVCGVEDGVHVAEKHKRDFPKTDIGKSCIRFKRIGDIDLAALEKVGREGAAALAKDAV
jgi:hypothetical protein